MRPNEVKWARIGPTSRKWFQHVPKAGMCLSAFLVVRDPAGGILFGRPRRHRAWPEKGCMPYWRLDDLIRSGAWVLPASHLMMEESPDHAASRIARDWAGLISAKPRLVSVDSSTFPGGGWEGRGPTRHRVRHWAIGFVYEAEAVRLPPEAPWWQEMKFVRREDLRKLPIGRAHRDLLAYLR